MSTPKPQQEKPSGGYSVKYSNKSGGAYADIKAVIQSERDTWPKSDRSSNGNTSKRNDQGPAQK